MKTLVLLSGGMDSVTALHWARQEHEVVGAVSFDYGAKHNHREIPLAAWHCAETGVHHDIIELDFVNRLFASDLLKSRRRGAGGTLRRRKHEKDRRAVSQWHHAGHRVRHR
jgi:7-cyano-7-deazaguanine synthase in queuosine biosynthesis